MAQLDQITLLKDPTTKGSIRWHINWYEEQFPRAHWKYRLAGVGVLLVALYEALGLKGEGWLSVSFVAATAAFLVSLNAFFAWGAAWLCISMPRSAWRFCCKRMRPAHRCTQPV